MVEKPSELSLTLHQASIPKPADILFQVSYSAIESLSASAQICSGSAGPSSLVLMWISTQSGTKNDVSLRAGPQSSSVQEDNLQTSLMYASGTGSSQKQMCLFPLERVFFCDTVQWMKHLSGRWKVWVQGPFFADQRSVVTLMSGCVSIRLKPASELHHAHLWSHSGCEALYKNAHISTVHNGVMACLQRGLTCSRLLAAVSTGCDGGGTSEPSSSPPARSCFEASTTLHEVTNS